MEGQLCGTETVVVVGSGNSAGQAAMFLSEGAAKVLLVVRGKDITNKMSDYLARRVQARENIEILYQTEIRKMFGGKKLEEIELENTQNGERRHVRTPAVFSMIGARPCTGLAAARNRARRQRIHQNRNQRGRGPGLAGESASTPAALNKPSTAFCCR